MNKVNYTYSGETQTFYFDFPYFNKNNIVVTVDNQPAPAYSVIGVKGGTNPDFPFISGRIVFIKPLKKFQTITIERHLPFVRQIDFQPTAPIDTISLNQDMNYTMELLKDLKAEIDSLHNTYKEITDKESTNNLLEKINLVNQNISDVSEKITQFEGSTASPDDLSELQDTIDTIRDDITEITTELNTLKQKMDMVKDFIIDIQNPTAENNYTWFKKYKSGHCEQGGIITSTASIMTISLPIEMATTHYHTNATPQTVGNYFLFCTPSATNSIQIRITSGSDFQPAAGKQISWSVKGIFKTN